MALSPSPPPPQKNPAAAWGPNLNLDHRNKELCSFREEPRAFYNSCRGDQRGLQASRTLLGPALLSKGSKKKGLLVAAMLQSLPPSPPTQTPGSQIPFRS